MKTILFISGLFFPQVSSFIHILVLKRFDIACSVQLKEQTTTALQKVDQNNKVAEKTLNSVFVYNSTTIKAIVRVLDGFSIMWTNFEQEGQTLRIKIASKVERDIRITVNFGNYLIRRSTADTKILLSAAKAPLRLFPTTVSEPQLLDSFVCIPTKERVRRNQSLQSRMKQIKHIPPLRAYRAVRVLPNMLKHDYQRRATAQALARFTPSGLSLTNLPTRWGRTLEPAKLAPAQLPASRQNRSTNGSSQRGRVERANYAFPRSIGSMRAVLANRAQKITLSALPNWDAVSVQMPTSTILNQRALIGYDIFEALDARSGVHKSAPPTGANGAEIGGLSIAKGAQNIMVIDTTAESTDTWEVLLIRTILVSMDIALFLLETMIVATIPVIRDGGGHLLARISDTFYLEERLEDASQAVATALSDWKEVAGILNYSGGANSSTAEATNEVRPQRWQEYPHFTHTK